ncbi:MAG TPA: PEP-CTERM sorting domain-containing protein [Stellaceae bacterium]|nr:PEP-CTERM sorting domain-containing protein [Stellaceae bacterium]
MFGSKITGKLRGGLLGAIVSAGVVGAGGQVAYALPTTWVLQNATLDDGGTASGEFTIDQYGYLHSPINITTSAGSLLSGFTYTTSDPSGIVPGTPPAYGVDFFSPSYNLDLHIVFQNSLESSGPNPIILASSYECAAFTCPGPDTGSPGANTRFFTGGDAVPAPEPASLGLLALGAVGVIIQRCRQRRSPCQVTSSAGRPAAPAP